MTEQCWSTLLQERYRIISAKKELEFINSQAKSKGQKTVLGEWESRGPWNVGGRTRAFCVDHTNPNVFLAGAASGGIWKSVDAGENWYKVTGNGINTAVTSMIQDPRPGHELEWYFTTGELFGASQSGVGAFYLGNGVYKSEDGGENLGRAAKHAAEFSAELQ